MADDTGVTPQPETRSAVVGGRARRRLVVTAIVLVFGGTALALTRADEDTQTQVRASANQTTTTDAGGIDRSLLDGSGKRLGDAMAAAAPKCAAGKNGGATDVGVTATKIKLAATNVRSGPATSSFGDAHIAMQAAVERVNRTGGICGRRLELRLVDDSFDAVVGARYLTEFADEDYFALAVVPSAEGLDGAIRSGLLSKQAIPVIGTDGLLESQHSDPWVWPVGPSSATLARLIVRHAYDNGARSFGVVYDSRHKFGREGAEALEAYVKTLAGAAVTAKVALDPEAGADTKAAVTELEAECGADRCDSIALLLLAETAERFMATPGRAKFGTIETSGMPSLFNQGFAQACREACDGVIVWTGFVPPIGNLQADPAVAGYVNTIKAVNPSVDAASATVEGAYAGMQLVIAALEQAGPHLTRARVREALDNMTFDDGLTPPLSWPAHSKSSTIHARPFGMVFAGGAFAGWRDVDDEPGFLRDPSM